MHCADACLGEQDIEMLVDCIRLDKDSAAACWAAADFMSWGSLKHRKKPKEYLKESLLYGTTEAYVLLTVEYHRRFPMKRMLLSFTLAFGLGCLALNSHADHARRPEVVRAIRSNAEAVKRDAASYQRRRVNSHFLRLQDDTRKLEKAMASHACLKEDVDALEKALTELRSASAEADAAKTTKAAQRLSVLSDGVLQKYCKGDAPSR